MAKEGIRLPHQCGDVLKWAEGTTCVGGRDNIDTADAA